MALEKRGQAGLQRDYRWQAPTRLLLRSLFGVLRNLKPDHASNMIGGIAALAGPYLGVSRIADQNLRLALPLLDSDARRQIIGQAWRNLGRVFGELPHLRNLKRTSSGPGWEIVGEENLPSKQAIFFSAHYNNWEMILPIASQLGLTVAGAYRRASNPAIEEVIQELRCAAHGVNCSMFAKGAMGARAAIAHLAQGGSLGLLVDQKMNDGIGVPFFGHTAMTVTAPAQLALRFGIPLIPIRIERIGPARFLMVCEPPLVCPQTGNRTEDILALTTVLNQTVESWIRADPGSWLWLHRRWPKKIANTSDMN
ncbi:lysophospholipid acyltransferase family protein [Komagataeibacter oboediens]|uniref:lysophospholipid acyltransferase family protein n=1 Tax=Komagataeibacter oboediens TaxID=65958 RepID=UPI000237F3C5|nr:lysophospholipid acyltransferase family protein [Komagataeibacter oboediens]